MEIAVCIELDLEERRRLARGVGDWPLTFNQATAPSNAAIVFGNPAPDVVAANSCLRWLQLESVGFGEYAGLDWSRSGQSAQVTNLAGFFADPVAETALAGILSLGRGIDRLVELRKRRDWVGDPVRGSLRLLCGSHVVLFGRGTINSRLAELLKPFRCRITAFGRDWTSDSLDSALATADVVVATVPHTPETIGLFDADRLSRLKPGAVFCNLGRGSLVDEEALARALAQEHLGGAVIDVTHDEPLPGGHVFWTAPNVILTQHSGGGSGDEINRKIDRFLENLSRFRSGTPLIGLVDFTRGY